MKIRDIIKNKDSWVYLERYVREGSQSYSAFSHLNTVNLKYQPSATSQEFTVSFLRVPNKKLCITLDNPSKSIREEYLGNESSLFAIHPNLNSAQTSETLRELYSFPIAKENVLVSPSSSTRTVFRSQSNHFLKLHLPFQISRFVRRLRSVSVEFSVKISADLREIQHPNFAYFPETIGIGFGQDDESIGYVIREQIPRPNVEGTFYYIPFFSLYSKDIYNADHEPLLVQLINASHEDPLDFLMERIISPLITSWCTAYKERGIILGSHAQNVVLEIDQNLKPTRVIHRDLDVQVDPIQRRKRNLESDFPKSRIGIDIQEPIERVLSLKYDTFIGHHLLDYLADTMLTHFGIPSEEIQMRTKACFNESLPDWKNHFDLNTYNYAQEATNFNEYPLVRVGTPKWR